MLRFSYEALHPEGKRQRGHVLANNEAEAVAAIEAQGLVPLALRLRRHRRLRHHGLRRLFAGAFQAERSLSRSGAMLLIGELARLTSNGATLERGLQIAEETAPDASAQAAATRLLGDLREGVQFSQALAQEQARGGVLPPHALGLIAAGEGSGDLGSALSRLSQDMERQAALRRSLRQALTYPLVLLGAALIACLVLLIMVVPQFKRLFEAAGTRASAEARALIGLSEFVQAYGLILLLVLILAGIAIRQLWRRPAMRYWRDAALLEVPGLGTLIGQTDAGRWCRSIGALMAGGATLSDALPIARAGVTNTALAAQIDAVTLQVSDGAPLSQALEEAQDWPIITAHYARIGEETGKLGDNLSAAGTVLDEEAQARVKTLASLAGPIIVLLLGLVIGSFIVVMFSAVLSLNDLAL
ncbi:MAG: type II secretion system F family protein [Neomegalonema sp.]|nr:type II secretion system F family protein [Neomegalonema sp.]